MYQLQNKLENVQSFKFIDGHVCVMKTTGFFVDDVFVDKECETFMYSVLKNKPIYVKNGTTYYGNIIIDKSFIENSLSGSIALFHSQFDLKSRTLVYDFIDIEKNQLLESLGRKPFIQDKYFSQNFYFCNHKEYVECYNLDQNVEKKWTFSYENINGQTPKITKIIGVFENQLILSVSSEKTILFVSIDTGKLEYTWKDIPGLIVGSKLRDIIPESNYFLVDHENSKLIGFFSRFYIEFDLIMRAVRFVNLTEHLSTFGIGGFIGSTINVGTKSHFFLTATASNDKFPDTRLVNVIAFNKKTLEVDWMDDVPYKNLGVNGPVLFRDLLYVKGYGGDVFVFEKTKSKNIRNLLKMA